MPIMGETQEETLANMMGALMESGTLIDEEEFEAIFFPPLESVDLFIQLARERGWSPEALYELDEEALEDVHFDIFQDCIPKLLTKEMKQKIIQALQDCHGRLQKQGKQQKAAQVGIVQFVLSDGEMDKASWQVTALVHSLIRRSVAAGFSLIETTGLHELEQPLLSKALAEASPGIDEKVEGLLKRIPGLRSYMEKQTDEVWDKGTQAVYTGQLYLGLFTEEEVMVAARLVNQSSSLLLQKILQVELSKRACPTLLRSWMRTFLRFFLIRSVWDNYGCKLIRFCKSRKQNHNGWRLSIY